MYFYDEAGKRVRYDTSNRIGGEQYGNVFKISDDECLKVYKKGQVVDDEMLKFMRELRLKKFYEIIKLLYGRSGNFRAHIARYYLPEEIDILTMPIEYTLYNLFDLHESVGVLTDNNVFITDMHTGNVIMGSNDITVIDTDIYTFNKFFSERKLREKNYSALRYLFTELYLEALKDYHPELSSFNNRERIKEVFEPVTSGNLDSTYKKLSRCKCPIDYIKKSR